MIRYPFKEPYLEEAKWVIRQLRSRGLATTRAVEATRVRFPETWDKYEAATGEELTQPHWLDRTRPNNKKKERIVFRAMKPTIDAIGADARPWTDKEMAAARRVIKTANKEAVEGPCELSLYSVSKAGLYVGCRLVPHAGQFDFRSNTQRKRLRDFDQEFDCIPDPARVSVGSRGLAKQIKTEFDRLAQARSLGGSLAGKDLWGIHFLEARKLFQVACVAYGVVPHENERREG